ncbi:MAG: DNA mismatch repair endonuclease MutL [Deltaproteobacteria bacterium]|nr:DNA mismatch repair endonuclease MutL [Deltaproteobacteria bacterium]
MSAEPRAPIRVLPPDLANQIAAGEVVERPASAVKELVENALDAGATQVDVVLRGSGSEEILIRDDGCGLARDEAALALLRHATSKLSREEDLRRIDTFGFRGEALPAIAAVSRLRLLTRRAQDDEGTEVLAEEGAEPIVRPAGAPPGTSISVRDLFYRTPARRKFLKSPRTELAACVKVVEWLALSHPEVGFSLHHDGRALRRFLPCTRIGDRVRAVLPEPPLAELGGSLEGLSVLAFLAGPEHAQKGVRNLELLVNGRRVNDRAVVAAVAASYEGMLPGGALPPGVVYLTLDPSAVDVNVHPRKEEVRFTNPRQIYSAVLHILRDGMARARGELHSGVPATAPQPFGSFPAAAATGLPRPPGASGTPASPWSLTPPASPPVQLPVFSPGAARPPAGPASAEGTPIPTADRPALSPSKGPPPAADPWSTSGNRPRATSLSFSSLVPAGQVFLTYLVCEGNDLVVLIDQHAAHERVVYEDLRASLRDGGLPSQTLLEPLAVPLRADLLAVVEDEAEALGLLGFEAEAFGADRALLRAHPVTLKGDPAEALRETAATLLHGRGGERTVVERGLATVACHSAIRAGKRVSDAEVHALLARMDEVDFGDHCPHGRPAWAVLSRAELEKMFGRR